MMIMNYYNLSAMRAWSCRGSCFFESSFALAPKKEKSKTQVKVDKYHLLKVPYH
jgi:hypothetical protein